MSKPIRGKTKNLSNLFHSQTLYEKKLKVQPGFLKQNIIWLVEK